MKSLHYYMVLHLVRFSDEFLSFYAMQIDTILFFYSLFSRHSLCLAVSMATCLFCLFML